MFPHLRAPVRPTIRSFIYQERYWLWWNLHIWEVVTLQSQFQIHLSSAAFCWGPGPLVHVSTIYLGSRTWEWQHSPLLSVPVTKSENKMATSTKAILALALHKYKQLQDKRGPSVAFKHGGQRGRVLCLLFTLRTAIFESQLRGIEEPLTFRVGNPTLGARSSWNYWL